MAHTTIEQFATELKMPAGALLEQLAAAGVAGKKEGDEPLRAGQDPLLDYLRKQHGAAGEPKKQITLTRKQTTEIKAAESTGKARTIQVEVRKKRVFVKRDETEAAPAAEEPVKAVAAPLISVEELAAREAEEKKAQELIARQQEEVQKKQEQVVKRKTKKEREAEEAAAKAAAAAAVADATKAPETAKSAKAPAAKTPTEGTLHRPAAKPGRAARSRPRRAGAGFQEEAARRRALKLRGDVTRRYRGRWLAAAQGGRSPAPRRRRRRRCCAGPRVPVIRDVTVPETITVAELAHKLSVKAAEVIKALMKLGHDGDHQPGARPGDRDDRGGRDGAQGEGREARRSGRAARGVRSDATSRPNRGRPSSR